LLLVVTEKGKKIEFLVPTSGGVGKIGWRITTKIAEFSDWCGLYEKIRTDFRENF